MPIDIQCAECKKKFRVADKFAGRRIKCPNCEKPIVVQAAESAAGQSSDAEPSDKTSSSDLGKTADRESSQRPAASKRSDQPEPAAKPKPDDAGPESDSQLSAEEEGQWYMQTDDGEQYGPVDREELNAWVAEGRIDGTCQLLCDGWDQWRWADEVFPDLAEEASTEDAPIFASGDSGKGIAAAAGTQSDTKLTARTARGGGKSSPAGIEHTLSETRPWVLLMAIVGFVCAGLGVLGTLGAMVPLILLADAIYVVVGIIVSLVMLATCGLIGWAAFHLFVYAQRIGAYVATSDTPELEQALAAQRSFWRLTGILTLAALGAWLITALLVLILMLAT